MNIETLVTLFAIAGVAALIGRMLGGFNLSGCLISYVLAVLGGIAGWVVQRQLFGDDNLLTVPFFQPPTRVSVIGAAVGALLLAFMSSLLSRPVAPRRPRSRRY